MIRPYLNKTFCFFATLGYIQVEFGQSKIVTTGSRYIIKLGTLFNKR